MPHTLDLVLALVLAAAAAALLSTLAIGAAMRIGFVDSPGGYKRHQRATPYLGGAAVTIAFAAVTLMLVAPGSEVGAVLAGAVVISLVGTVDDRISLGALPRLAIETGIAATWWRAGLGWSAFNSDIAGLALTIVWIVGLVNAFNLMDNIDGAAGTVGAVCAAGAAVAVFPRDPALALVAVALSGACVGFLSQNLKRPARIFLGDGGSMPIGFVVATVLLAAIHEIDGFGAAAVVVAAPFAGVVIIDTTLVVVSRTRRGVAVLAGARDHLTHRLLRVLDTPRRVALALGLAQAALSGLGLVLAQSGRTAVLVAGAVYIALGATLIIVLDRLESLQPEWTQETRERIERIPARRAPVRQEAALQQEGRAVSA